MKRQDLRNRYPLHDQYRDGIGHRPEIESKPLSFVSIMGYFFLYTFSISVLLFFGLCWIDAIMSFHGVRR